ncbi:MAG TPA: HDOD domain-containing protein, partial [Tepidisphaeraceae bacterium]|nr:HDOD domain-containing protein [Tepidisphaeraceae bacterium]
MANQPDKRVDLILQQLEELPTLPTVALRILEITGSDDASTSQVVKLIQSDPSLTARILQLVHRADSGVRGEVNSIDRAVVLLGFEAIRSAVLAVSVFETFQAEQPKGAHFVREEFWKHCVAVACCAEMLAGQISEIEPGEAFVCGLLHDLGKVALDAVLPKSFNRVVEAADLLRGNIADVERQVIGLDHMVVGKRLAERWQLPTSIRDCIWLHGQTPEALPATVKHPRLVNLITLADLIVRRQHLGYSGNYSETVSQQTLMDLLKIQQPMIERTLEKLVGQIEQRAVALGLGRASSGALYQQALSQANKELGKVSAQLATKNRRLAIRAKFFDALSSFHAELRPDAPPQMVLHAIGQTAVEVLSVTSAAVFSLSPGKDYAETLMVDSNGDVFDTTVIECPAGAPKLKTPQPVAQVAQGAAIKPSLGEGPVLATGAEMEWLLQAVSPRLGHDHRYWICLEADGTCIGGVIWGASAGEAQRLSNQVQELTALAGGWSLALRTTQIREEARTLAEQLAEANRQLQSAQNEILRSKTVITVGEMAAGAAHEMNNPLMVISGRSQLLAAQLEDPKLKASAHLIYDQSHRLSQIITELMDFAKPVPPSPIEIDPAELVDRALHEAKTHTDPADRTIEVTFGDVPQVIVDRDQVCGALVEVIDNALQATDEKSGVITIHGGYDPYSRRVVLTIADNGCGMEEQTLKRAFDPFFSAKQAGRRRGMGLSKALRWVEASSGS